MKAKQNKDSLFWVNPESHYVYDGMLKFFSERFIFTMYDANNFAQSVSYWTHKKLLKSFALSFLQTFFLFFKDPFDPFYTKAFWIRGDIFTNFLCLKSLFFRPRSSIFFSSHFIKYKESFLKKLFFFLYGSLFVGKKIIVPTQSALSSFSFFSKKVFVFPQLYLWDLYENNSLGNKRLKILVVVWQFTKRKRVDFLLDAVLSMSSDLIDVWLCGLLSNDFDLEFYKKAFWERLHYYWFIDHSCISSLYLSHNLLVLPSQSDPIWAVIVEAMAHSLPIVVSNNVGASSYIVEGYNWYVFPYDNLELLVSRIDILLDPEIRVMFGSRSRVLVHDNHWYHNRQLVDSLWDWFLSFMYS